MTEEVKDPAETELFNSCLQKYDSAFADKRNMAYAVIQALNCVVH